jgi:hypothetical protein
MVIDPQSAQIFINGYSKLLAEVHRLSKGNSSMSLLEILADARKVIIASPSIIGEAALSLERKSSSVPQEVISAIKSLQLKQWVYLRDTTRYSVFLDPSGRDAYAVLGLMNRVRDLLGGSGVSFQTGIVDFAGHFVCDGVVSSPVWLGANYRRDFSAHLAILKKEGKFHAAPIH